MHDHVATQKNAAVQYWGAEPRNRPVKVTSVSRQPMFWAEGFITCYKFIGGRSLQEVEQILGLRHGELSSGAYMHEFLQLPTPEQFVLKGYSQCPDGKPWTPASQYPAGRGAPQWEVKRNSFIPSRVAALVSPGQRFP